MKSQKGFSFVDLFSGIGGFKIALRKNGGNCVGFSEVDKDAIEYYCLNHKVSSHLNLGDIRKIQNVPKHDLLTAGVPCQSWSIAGKNLGFDDDRGQLWNDTIYILEKAQPKAFIFENVKGLADPRNAKALRYILERIKSAGYFAKHFVLNSYDFGVPQNRVRLFIIGFREKHFFDRFEIVFPKAKRKKLADVLNLKIDCEIRPTAIQKDIFGNPVSQKSMSLSSKNGLNDYFLFNDLRNGHSTIHSWDIKNTTFRQKEICHLLLKNRRKSQFGKLDGNPLSLKNFQSLDPTIEQAEIDGLIDLEILSKEEYLFHISKEVKNELTENASRIVEVINGNEYFTIDDLKADRSLKLDKIKILDGITELQEKEVIKCKEIRYDFKNTKISTGLYGVNRVFMPTSDIFPTLVASDTNDYVTEVCLNAKTHEEYKIQFMERIYKTGNFRKLSKEEACDVQGFPRSFELPKSRARWMKLLGNSVSVPVIDSLCNSIIKTGVFEEEGNKPKLDEKIGRVANSL